MGRADEALRTFAPLQAAGSLGPRDVLARAGALLAAGDARAAWAEACTLSVAANEPGEVDVAAAAARLAVQCYLSGGAGSSVGVSAGCLHAQSKTILQAHASPLCSLLLSLKIRQGLKSQALLVLG
jgi:hypothetical protein